MAALTAATTIEASSGDLKHMIYTFAAVTDADTFASGLSGVVASVYTPTGATATGGGVVESSGTFTLRPIAAGESGLLQVWCRC